jgi:adenylate cyclase
MRNRKRAYSLCLVFFCIIHSVISQDQKVADSLARIYPTKNSLPDTVQLELLRNLSFNEVNDFKLALRYADELIKRSEQLTNNLYLHRGYYQKGNINKAQGNLDEALKAYIISSEVARKANYNKGVGLTFGAMADIHAVSHNYKNAMLYYHKAISALRLSTDSVFLASVLLNAGDVFNTRTMYDSAALYFEEARVIFERVNHLSGKAYSLGNIGMVYANTGETELAEKNINEAIRILEQTEDYYPICVYLISIGDIYLKKGDERTALNYALRSLKLAEKYGLKEQIADANHKLADLYEKAGNYEASVSHFKNYITYRDSVSNIQSVQQMADLRTDFEVSQKQIEVDLLDQQKKNQRIIIIASVIASLLIFLLAIGLYRRYHFIKETNVIIEAEKNRSEKLLLNILPEETARELKKSGTVQAKKFESVTVLFTDFKGFTSLAEQVEPEQLVKSIDYYFKEFDKISVKYGLEKIKTIGDAYMCAGGLPIVNKTHAKDVTRAAVEMITLVRNVAKAQDDLTHFEIRIGVHTGPVVAGIVGSMKWQYDIWGDTVNIASRMESMSEVGMINLSETTYLEINDEFPCEYRGMLDVKNRGALKMYFLL